MQHPVRYHLTNKLTWMARQMRTINDAATIIDWMAAMKAVHDMLVDVLGNKDLQVVSKKKLPLKPHLFPRQTSSQSPSVDIEEQRNKVLTMVVDETNENERGMDTHDKCESEHSINKPKIVKAGDKHMGRKYKPNPLEVSDLPMVNPRKTCDSVRTKRCIVKGKRTLDNAGKWRSMPKDDKEFIKSQATLPSHAQLVPSQLQQQIDEPQWACFTFGKLISWDMADRLDSDVCGHSNEFCTLVCYELDKKRRHDIKT